MWTVEYLPEVEKDFKSLGRNDIILVNKAILKVAQNPLPKSEGGYGEPLGNKMGRNLTGLFKIKLRGPGIRVVYKLQKADQEMLIVVIGIREDEEVYNIAFNKSKRHF